MALALLTGNFIEGARIKLEYFDLWKYFPCGAFGGDAHNRNDLVPIAVRARASAASPTSSRRDVIVVGDTPNDVECALVAGATPVAVATGSYTVDRSARDRRRHRVRGSLRTRRRFLTAD